MERYCKVITFFGADSKVGVTMVTQSVAEKLAESEYKILMFFCDGKIGGEYIKNNHAPDKGIDAIYTEIISDVITIEQFLDACYLKNNLYLLPGTASLIFRKRYSPEFVQKIIDIAAKHFDFILLDAGNSTDMGLTVGALEYSDLNYLITTQQKSSEEIFLQKQIQILSKVNVRFSGMLINKYEAAPFFPDAIDLEEKYKIKRTIEIPQFDNFGWKSEKDRNTLLSYNLKKYNLAISSFVNALIGDQIQGTEKKYFHSYLRRVKNE